MPRRRVRVQSVPVPPEPERAAITVPEAAFMGHVSVATAWKLVGSGEWPSFRVGRKRLIPRARLEALINGTPAEPVEAAI
jgi:excisionase family DNA binding protein